MGTRKLRPGELDKDHAPTGVAFLDESGSISKPVLYRRLPELSEPSVLLRRVQKLRDIHHWYHEIHFVKLTKGALPFYKEVVKVVAASDAEFSCFVADRDQDDPVARFGGHMLRTRSSLLSSRRKYPPIRTLDGPGG